VTARKLPKEFLEYVRGIKAKRPRTVIEHIISHGYVTTEELESKYGYAHAPRAARDVRELGVPLETFRVKDSKGRTIAAYRFADVLKIRGDMFEGRKIIPKEFKQSLVKETASRCYICLEPYEERYLQVDHRVPYEVWGDVESEARDLNDYMLICGSCNRAKSWSCEHCPNWLKDKKPEVCKSCYWGSPEGYKHIALKPFRRLDVVWTGSEVEIYDRLRERAERIPEDMPDYVKDVIKKHVMNSNSHTGNNQQKS